MSAVHELAPGARNAAGGLAHQRIATAVMIAFFALAPLVAYPVFLMKVMCFALFALRLHLLIGYGGPCPSGTPMFLAPPVCLGGNAAKVWVFRPSSLSSSATGVSALLGLVTGLLAIPAGHLLAMITLALGRWLYFF